MYFYLLFFSSVSHCFLFYDLQVIETERGQQLADEYSIKFMETSAKNSINVDQAFITLAQDIKKRLIDTDGPGPGPAPKGDVKLDTEKKDGGKDCAC